MTGVTDGFLVGNASTGGQTLTGTGGTVLGRAGFTDGGTFRADLDLPSPSTPTLTFGALTIEQFGIETLAFSGTADGTSTYVLAAYQSLAGSFDSVVLPESYELDYGPRTSPGQITITPVPEPGAALLSLGGGALLVRGRRARRQSRA